MCSLAGWLAGCLLLLFSSCPSLLLLFFLYQLVIVRARPNRRVVSLAYWRSVARNFSSTDSRDASDRSVAWMYFCTPTSAFFSASNEEEYNIFFLTCKGR